jgi:hypothetical protein
MENFEARAFGTGAVTQRDPPVRYFELVATERRTARGVVCGSSPSRASATSLFLRDRSVPVDSNRGVFLFTDGHSGSPLTLFRKGGLTVRTGFKRS